MPIIIIILLLPCYCGCLCDKRVIDLYAVAVTCAATDLMLCNASSLWQIPLLFYSFYYDRECSLSCCFLMYWPYTVHVCMYVCVWSTFLCPESNTRDTCSRNFCHKSTPFFCCQFLVRVSFKSATGFVWYKIPVLIRTLFYFRPQSGVHMTEMIICDLFLFNLPLAIQCPL